MFRRRHLKNIHAKFLDSCRSLADGRAYWQQATGLRHWLIRAISPIPLLGLQEDGQRLLSALQWLEENCLTQALAEDTIRRYHKIVFGNRREDAGEYRRLDIQMRGDNPLRPPPGSRVPLLMKQLHLKLSQDQDDLTAQHANDLEQVLRSALLAYYRIGAVHPFEDGNGRVARLSMNHLLRRYGAGYVIFPPITKDSPIMGAFQNASRGDLETLVGLAKQHLHPV